MATDEQKHNQWTRAQIRKLAVQLKRDNKLYQTFNHHEIGAQNAKKDPKSLASVIAASEMAQKFRNRTPFMIKANQTGGISAFSSAGHSNSKRHKSPELKRSCKHTQKTPTNSCFYQMQSTGSPTTQFAARIIGRPNASMLQTARPLGGSPVAAE